MIVLTVTAIVIVGFVLAWDVFDFKGKLDKLFNTDLYATEEPLYRSDVSVTVSTSNPSVVPDDERTVIENYFTCYYASLGGFYRENISRFFGFQCTDEHLDLLALDFEIAAAKNSLSDYSFDSCEIYLYITDRRKNIEGEIEITLRSSASYIYDSSSEPTEISGENHIFTMASENKETVIAGHTTDRTSRKFADYIFDLATASDGFTRDDLSYTYYYDYLEKSKAILELCREDYKALTATALSDGFIPSFEAEYPYDAENACLYAVNSSGHSETYGSYDENDANFCSQCITAGGIPMDDQGNSLTQWKWYGYDINNGRTKEGCTLTWYDRGRFWRYATENTGFGMVAESSEYARRGDIIQLMNGETPVLECIVTDIVYDNSETPVDFIICTDKIKNMPLSLLWNGDLRFLNIIGYNTANI